MKKEYLPIGSVVLLKDSKKKLMITGFYVKPNDSDVYFDYLGCIFPEGMVSNHDNYIFNNEQIDKIVYRGLEDEEESLFKSRLYEIIGEIEGKKDNKVISIPVSIYKDYNSHIISVPIDEYNKATNKIISVPADLYKKACGTSTHLNNIISIPSKVYKDYNSKKVGAKIISIPKDLYEKNNKKSIISIPFGAYKKSTLISVPFDEYKRVIESNNVIRINAKTYEEFLNNENNIISDPIDKYREETSHKKISIPLNLYKKLIDEEKNNIITVPLDVYEKMVKKESEDVISIPLSEYERLTRGHESNGVISIPSSVYNEILRKDKSNVESSSSIIEVPYDLYKKTMANNN